MRLKNLYLIKLPRKLNGSRYNDALDQKLDGRRTKVQAYKVLIGLGTDEPVIHATKDEMVALSKRSVTVQVQLDDGRSFFWCTGTNESHWQVPYDLMIPSAVSPDEL